MEHAFGIPLLSTVHLWHLKQVYVGILLNVVVTEESSGAWRK